MTVFVTKTPLFSYFSLRLSRLNVLISKYVSEAFINERLEDVHRPNHQFLSDLQTKTNEPQDERKILKAAIIGNPNAGKSTLINQIVGRRVFPISKKVHTTQCKARAVHNIGNTQLVFLDTPGLVTHSEAVRYNLGQNFMTDGEEAITSADVVGVIHDVSNSFTRGKLDPKVLRLLHLYPKKNMVLILNKIDCLKSKRTLLDLADKLTSNKLSNRVVERRVNKSEQISEFEIQKRIKNESGWPGFQEVFMVSAIEGFGIGDIMEYLLKMARPGPWLFPEDVYTDQNHKRIIEEAVRSKLLDYVPYEMPYNVKIELELFEQNENGTIVASILVTCPSPRIEKLIRGGKDGKIRIITRETQEDLKNTFQQNVNLRIIVAAKENIPKL